jgi:hypothetical protein
MQQTIELPPAPPERKKRTRLWLNIAVAITALIAVGTVAWFTLWNGGQPRLEAAYEDANLTNSEWFQLADEGRTIVVDGPLTPDVESAVEFDQPLPTEQELNDAISFFRQLDRLYDALEMPTYVESQIGTTTSLAGEQTATFDGLEASWSYHPDSGLDMTIHEQEG